MGSEADVPRPFPHRSWAFRIVAWIGLVALGLRGDAMDRYIQKASNVVCFMVGTPGFTLARLAVHLPEPWGGWVGRAANWVWRMCTSLIDVPDEIRDGKIYQEASNRNGEGDVEG